MSGDGLVPPLNAPAAAIPTPGVQPGISGQIILAHYVIIFGTAGGVFIYSGTPANGNPPIAWMTSATADPYGNTIEPGIFLAELASSGNALGGLLWNTIVGSEPLLALYPDATVGFSGNSPFILGRVFNRGAVNELLSLAMGGGGTAGTGSPVQVEAFSQSKDGTILGHVSFYDWASTDLICDVNVNGIVAADPVNANTLETWHAITLDSGWSTASGYAAPSYRLLPDGNLQLTGLANFGSSQTVNHNLNNSHPLPSVYCPATNKLFRTWDGQGGRATVQISTGGVIEALGNSTYPYQYCEIDAVLPLNK